MDEALVGRNLIALGLRSPLWVPRKLDHIEFLDSSTARRTVRLDIDLSRLDGWRTESGERDYERWPQWRGGLLVPLAILPRSFYTPIEIFSSVGELMPRLTKSEERGLAEKGLLGLASSDVPTSPELAQLTHALVHEEPIENLQEFLHSRPAGEAFLEGDGLLDVAAILNTQYLLLTRIPDDIDRQVITYSVISRLIEDGPGRPWLSRVTRLARGLDPKPTIKVQIGLGDTPSGSESYHVQATNPHDLVFVESRLNFRRLLGANPSNCEVKDRDMLPNLGHVHLSGSRRVTDCCYSATLCHIPTGLVRAAPFSTLLTALMLAAGALWVWQLPAHALGEVDTQLGAGILLLIPALIGTLLAAPKSHNLTARVLFRTRFLLLATSLTPTFPAAAMALKWQGAAHLIMWSVAAGVAGLATVYLAVQCYLAWRWTERRTGA